MRSNIARMYVFKFLISMHLFAGVLIPFFMDWGGISFARVMLLQSWFVFWMFLLEAPTGAVADRFGRKASLICGAACLSAAVLVYSSRPDFRVFLAGELLWAMAGAFVSGADEALLYDSLKAAGEEASSKAVLGRLASFELAAILVSAPAGSLIAQRWGLRAPLVCMVVPFLLASLVALTLREPPGGEPEGSDYWRTLKEGLAYAAGHRVLRILAFDAITIFCFSFMVIWLFQPFLKSLGTPIAWFGVVVSLSTGTEILLLNNLRSLERLAGGARRYLLASALIPGLACLGLSMTRHPLLAVPLIVLAVAFGLSRWVVVSNYMHKHIESRRRATVISSVSMARQLFGAFLYPVVGGLEAWSLRGTFAVLGAVLLLSAWLSEVEEGHLLD